ncbi:MAG: hypothetical protein H7Y11_01550, partial [Armatimonadetes bacterium]|nr:hypothetical protein [Anaerolineae bacterium]
MLKTLHFNLFQPMNRPMFATNLPLRWWIALRSLVLGLLLAMVTYIAFALPTGELLTTGEPYQNEFLTAAPLAVVAVAGVLAMLYLDYAGVRAGALLVAQADGLENQHLAHQRVWRLTLLLVGWRIGVVILMLFNLPLAAVPERRANFFSWYFEPALAVWWVPVLVMLSAYYVLEPIWRSNLTIAFGMADAARHTPPLRRISLHARQWLIIYGLGMLGLYLLQLLTTPRVTLGYSHPSDMLDTVVMTYGDLTFFLDREARIFLISNFTMESVYVAWALTTTVLLGFAWRHYRVTTRRYWQLAAQPSQAPLPTPWLTLLMPWHDVVQHLRLQSPLLKFEVYSLKHGGTVASLAHWTRRLVRRLLVVLLILGVGGGLLYFYSWYSYFKGYREIRALGEVMVRV